MDFTKELHIASLAVHQASILTNSIQSLISQTENTLSKDAYGDPVTIADFASQAMIINIIHHYFPSDTFVGEEDESMLRGEPLLLNRVWDLVDKLQSSSSAKNVEGEGIPLLKNKEEILNVIGLGGKQETAKGRVWMLDPIDGTKTFLTGHQYAVSLALIIDGEQKVGVLGCPNIAAGTRDVREEIVDKEGLGVLLSAVKGQGAYWRSMNVDGTMGTATKMEKLQDVETLKDLRYVNSMASSHISKPVYLTVKKECGLDKEHDDEEVDLWSMHIKYAALALGGVNCMVRIPPKRSYHGYVWDHAGGQLIYQEAGGKLTDVHGERFDFGAGRKLERNWGVVAAAPNLHAQLLEIIKRVLLEFPIE